MHLDRLGRHLGLLPNLSEEEARISSAERRWRREARSSWLRLAVLLVLWLGLSASEPAGSSAVQHLALLGYGTATLIMLVMASLRRGPSWMGSSFVLLDAIMVVGVLHEHLFGATGTLDHKLTAPSLAVAFMLLSHVALRSEPTLVTLFAGTVIAGWLLLLVGVSSSDLVSEAVMIVAFVFSALVCYLLTRDHNLLLRSTLVVERRRRNLSRFFSPAVVAEIESRGAAIGLVRRAAAVMFVDLRSFTLFSERAKPEEVGEMLTDYRQLITTIVFKHGGTIDKFIGDGVMAVFGHPAERSDDGRRALACALEAREALAAWKAGRERQGKVPLSAGIGLHQGIVVGGVLRSGGHDEFTVFGDAVNIAERLERLSKTLQASLVVSADLLRSTSPSEGWIWLEAAPLEGREAALKIAYLR